MRLGANVAAQDTKPKVRDESLNYSTFLTSRCAGLNVYTVSLQNEPLNENKSYPTMKVFSIVTCLERSLTALVQLTADQEAKVGNILRPLLDQNGFSDVKLIAFDHNWSNPSYPTCVPVLHEDTSLTRLIAQGSCELISVRTAGHTPQQVQMQKAGSAFAGAGSS